jgi:hypothetical protein
MRGSGSFDLSIGVKKATRSLALQPSAEDRAELRRMQRGKEPLMRGCQRIHPPFQHRSSKLSEHQRNSDFSNATTQTTSGLGSHLELQPGQPAGPGR